MNLNNLCLAQNPLDLSKRLQMFTTLFHQFQILSSKLSQKLCLGLLFVNIILTGLIFENPQNF
jgi:hypothetical protein